MKRIEALYFPRVSLRLLPLAIMMAAASAYAQVAAPAMPAAPPASSSAPAPMGPAFGTYGAAPPAPAAPAAAYAPAPAPAYAAPAPAYAPAPLAAPPSAYGAYAPQVNPGYAQGGAVPYAPYAVAPTPVPGSYPPGYAGSSQVAGTGSGAAGSVLNGTGLSPGQLASMASKLSPTQIQMIAAKRGMSADQLQALQRSLANGTISQRQIDSLSARLGAQCINPQDVQTIGAMLGLSSDQINQLQSNMSRIGAGTAQTAPPPNPMVQYQSNLQGGAPANAGPSQIEQTFRTIDLTQGQVPEFTGPEDLQQFGYSFFSSQANIQNLNISPFVPVGPDYVLGPGDQMQVMMWGTRNETDQLIVDRNGAVQVPSIGPIQVAGMKFDHAKQVIESKVEQITGVHASVTMGQIRTMNVFVVGDVNNPGPYTVNSLARLTDALVAAGGPTKVGSLRRIQLKRGNKVVLNVDLYNVLLHGDTSADVRLQDRDVVFVPSIGPVVGVAGDLKRPGIYELTERRQNLGSVLNLAGGVDAYAYTRRIQVERVDNHQRRVIVDTTLDKLPIEQLTISDGDLVKVFPVLPVHRNKVTLLGNVFRPGDYQWKPGLKLSDLIAMGEGVQPRTYFHYALVKRLEGKQLYPHYLQVNLGQALENPNTAADIPLQVFDEVTVYNQDDLRNLPTVTVTGEVRIPGTYKLDPNMRISDLVYLAGGLTDSAYQKSAELARTQVADGSVTQHHYLEVDLRKALDGDKSGDLTLQPNDELFVRTATNWHLPWTVMVSGRVARPGSYTVHENERLSSLIGEAGGFLPDAYPQGMVLVRDSVKEEQQKELDKARLDLQQQLATAAFSQSSLSQTSSGASQSTSAVLASAQQILASSSTLQASGRIVVNYGKHGFSGPEDVVLQDKDDITIPRQPSSVNVLGQVYNPTAVIARPGLTVRRYLDLAGGPTTLADTDHLLVIRADGGVVTPEGYKDAEENRTFPLLPIFSGGLEEASLNPGDTIYVPYKIPDYTSLTVKKDITQIIAQTAQSVAMVGILATNL